LCRSGPVREEDFLCALCSADGKFLSRFEKISVWLAMRQIGFDLLPVALLFLLETQDRNIDGSPWMTLQGATGSQRTHLSFSSVSPCLRGAKVLLFG